MSRYRGRGAADMGLLAAAAVCLLLALACGFILPGVRFSAVLFAGLSALCLAWTVLNRWAARSAGGRLCKRAASVCLGLLFLAFVTVEGVIVSDGEKGPSPQPVDAVIVLGAGVNGRTPSLVLQGRIEAAAAYLREHPAVPVILSGGQGPGEDISEAQAMYNGLTRLGVDPKLLHLEGQSTTTAENFQCSAAVLRELGIDPTHDRVALVTSDFHMFRAGLLAMSQAVVIAEKVPAEAPWWWLSANYYTREFFALGKMALVQLIP